jgi:subtilisin family serine protease
VVRLQPGTDLKRFNRDYNLRVLQQLGNDSVFRFQTAVGAAPDAMCGTMAQDPRVIFAEPDLFVRRPEKPKQWTSTFDGGGPRNYANQHALAQADFRATPRASDGAGVTVAILDTGISSRQPALNGHLVPGWNILTGRADPEDFPNHRDDDGNGYIDEATGHGTMVAGIVALLAPKARLMPVKVLNSDGVGNLYQLVEGIHWALDHGANVLNMSLGVPRKSDALSEALDEAYARGAVVVTSAGNQGAEQAQFPANISKVLTVAALNPDNTKADFSSYGSVVDVCAPGVDIYSTNWSGGYTVWSGTSFAAPFVTAEVALVWSRYPRTDNQSLQRAITDTARNVDGVNPAYKGRLGKGLIDIDRAVASRPRIGGAADD